MTVKKQILVLNTNKVVLFLLHSSIYLKNCSELIELSMTNENIHLETKIKIIAWKGVRTKNPIKHSVNYIIYIINFFVLWKEKQKTNIYRSVQVNMLQWHPSIKTLTFKFEHIIQVVIIKKSYRNKGQWWTIALVYWLSNANTKIRLKNHWKIKYPKAVIVSACSIYGKRWKYKSNRKYDVNWLFWPILDNCIIAWVNSGMCYFAKSRPLSLYELIPFDFFLWYSPWKNLRP